MQQLFTSHFQSVSYKSIRFHEKKQSFIILFRPDGLLVWRQELFEAKQGVWVSLQGHPNGLYLVRIMTRQGALLSTHKLLKVE